MFSALTNKRAAQVSRELEKVIMTFGLPDILQTDNGLEFANRLVRSLCGGVGMRHVCSTPYQGMRISKAGRTVIEVEKPKHDTTFKLDIAKALMVRKGIVKWMGHLNPTDVKRIIENKVVGGAAISPSC